jgi:hypothetical protein
MMTPHARPQVWPIQRPVRPDLIAQTESGSWTPARRYTATGRGNYYDFSEGPFDSADENVHGKLLPTAALLEPSLAYSTYVCIGRKS